MVAGTDRGAGPVRLVLGLAVVMVVLAAARPTVELDPGRRPSILTLVVDTSGSTMADDLAPSRLQAIKRATDALLDKAPPDLRVGLIRFAEEAETLTRPTTDHHAVRRHLAALSANGGTAIGDALQRALDGIQATDPAAPAVILLLSDGANSAGRDPLEVARIATAPLVASPFWPSPSALRAASWSSPSCPEPLESGRSPRSGPTCRPHRPYRRPGPPGPVLTTARRRPHQPAVGRRHRRRAPRADPAVRRRGASAAGDRRRPHRRRPARGRRPPTLGPSCRAAGRRRHRRLAVDAVAADRSPTGRPAGHHRRRRPGSATPSRLARWPGIPRDPPAELGHRRPRPPPSRQPDHRASHQPAVPPRRTREQRPAELGRPLSKSFRLDLTACESCKPGALSAPASYFTPLGADCEATLNLPLLKQQAKRARLPVTELTALAILHEQEQCLRQDGITLAPLTAEQRLVRKLRQAANGPAGSRHPPRPP